MPSRIPIRLPYFIVFVLAIFAPCIDGNAGDNEVVHSELWGEAGEKWDPKGLLKDFSDAGYHEGNDPLPEWPVGVNVRDHGAKGNGRVDDTDAIRAAIAACEKNEAVFFPSGTYLITDIITIRKSNVVLRGAGRTQTLFHFPVGLEELHPKPAKTNHGTRTSEWSWSGGFITFKRGREQGIEHIGFIFPDEQYPGHFKELGYNGVSFEYTEHGWARDLLFFNCESGIYASPGRYLTFTNLLFDEYPGRARDLLDRGRIGGHHGVTFKSSSHCVVDGFVFKNRMWHELTIEFETQHCVFSNGKGPNLHFDHHQTTPHGNLWTDIDVGAGDYVWDNNARIPQGGEGHSGSTKDEVYWNIRSEKDLLYPAPELNNVAVGFQTDAPSQMEPDGPWHETIPPEKLAPQNLFRAQRAFRGKFSPFPDGARK